MAVTEVTVAILLLISIIVLIVVGFLWVEVVRVMNQVPRAPVVEAGVVVETPQPATPIQCARGSQRQMLYGTVLSITPA